MAETFYCYHCGKHHPIDEMRVVPTKAGLKKRCAKSIDATKRDTSARDAFGKIVTATNSANRKAASKATANLKFLGGE